MKSIITILLFAASLVSTTVQAQMITEYTKTPGINTRFSAIVPVSDDPSTNLYVAGNYGPYLFIGEFEQSGVLVWSKKINVSDTSMVINRMIRDSNGHLVLAGTSINAGIGRAFVLKFNTVSQKVAWYKKSTASSYFWDITELGAGGDYLIGGSETGSGTGNQSDDITYLVGRYTGDLTLHQNLNKNVNENVSALLFNEETSSIYTTGRYELASGVTKFRLGLNKLDMDGNVLWSRYYIKSTSGSGRFYPSDIIKDDDEIIIVGEGDDGGTNYLRYLWLIKTDLDGNALLTNKYDISGTSNDGIATGLKKYDEGYIFSGTLHNGTAPTDIFLFNIDFSGNINWAKSYPFSTRWPTTGLYNTGSMAIIGNYIFQVGEKKQPDGTMKGVLMRVPLATGDAGTCDVDITCSVTSLPDNFDDFTTLVPVTCDLPFNAPILTRSKQNLSAEITCSINGFTTGDDDSKEAFDNLQSDMMTVGLLNIYPNPSNGIFNIHVDEAVESGTIMITNITGAVICQYDFFDDADRQMTLDQVVPGIYNVILLEENRSIVESQRFVVF